MNHLTLVANNGVVLMDKCAAAAALVADFLADLRSTLAKGDAAFPLEKFDAVLDAQEIAQAELKKRIAALEDHRPPARIQ